MTKKSLREKLAETSSRPDARNSAKHLAMFLDRWKEVDMAFREGWSYKEIWRALRDDGDIDFSYSVFGNLVRKVRRRQFEHDRERTRRTNGPAAARIPPAKPGGTRVELPLFGKETPPRDPKRF